MTPGIRIALLLFGWLTVAAQATPGQLERVFLFGNDYVRLEPWAASKGLKASWFNRNHELRLSGEGNTLRFEADSAKIIFNGITVYLSAPFAVRNTSGYVSPQDIRATLDPLLSPVRQARKATSICLDAGHGGKDPGRFSGREQEKKYTLLLAREVGEQLSTAGFKVSYTRSKDSFVELSERSEYARQHGADLFVSLHFNSVEGSGSETVKGVEVYCLSPAHTSSTNTRGDGSAFGNYDGNRFDSKNVLLAYEMQKSLVTRLGLEDRGVKRARYMVLRTADMPAILIESGFLSNRAEAARIYDPKYRRQLAQAIVQGIQD